MRKLSSKHVFFFRFIFPLFPFLMLGPFGFAVLMGLFLGAPIGEISHMVLGLAFGWVFFTVVFWFVGSLYKEVWIDDDELVVSNYFKTERIPTNNIKSVYAVGGRTSFIEVWLHEETMFGRKIWFIPIGPKFFIKHNPIYLELLELVQSR